MNKTKPKAGLGQPLPKGKKNSKRARRPKQLPSKLTCGICYCNKYNDIIEHEKVIALLKGPEKIKEYQKEIYDLESIPTEPLCQLIAMLKKCLSLEMEKEAQVEEEKLKSIARGHDQADLPTKGIKKIIIGGLKNEFIQHAGYYYFSPFCPYGLHLSALKIPQVAQIICDNFLSENGTCLQPRVTRRELHQGMKMNEKGVIIEK